jgi:23S rRNA pseudouridine1911/1915/1917 synthase
MDVVEYISRSILFEDNHLLVLNKHAGDIVQGDITGTEPLLEKAKAYIKVRYNKPGNVFLGLPHRLDQPVSGAVIFSRTSKALARLNQMLQNREIRKIYWAVVKNRPPDDEALLVHYMSRNRQKNKSYAFPSYRKNAQKAELKYRWLASGDNYHLLEIELLTGRHHQIRSQLSVIGCPVKGDLKYGAPRPNTDASIHLHARKLKFDHPVSNETLQIIAPVPEDALWKFFEKTCSG